MEKVNPLEVVCLISAIFGVTAWLLAIAPWLPDRSLQQNPVINPMMVRIIYKSHHW